MSDDEKDIDIESDDGDDSDCRQENSDNTQYSTQAEKRAHHNALERKRRDRIKDSFSDLRESVYSLQGEKVNSRAQILKKAAEYIQFMRRKNISYQQDIDDLKRQNTLLEAQVRTLEEARLNGINGNFTVESCEFFVREAEAISVIEYNESEFESSESETERATRPPKRLKVSSSHH